jgi:ribosomal protein L7/L12
MECSLCYETSNFFGVTECGHSSICSLCWYRLRSILQKNACPVCRQPCPFLFITSDASAKYDLIFRTQWGDAFPGFFQDSASQIYFSDQAELARLQNLRRPLCKLCTHQAKNLSGLKEHLFTYHARKICDLCVHNSNLFASEQELYEEEAFKIHKITAHVQCDLCFNYSYDQRALLQHIKKEHFFCELCPVEKRTAYTTYGDLEGHYRKEHYLCEVEVCRDETHVVFMCYDDLKDHYRANHPTLAIPAPVLAFKVKEDVERPAMVFEDFTAKTYAVPKIDEQNREIEFPALAPATAEEKPKIDYSKIKNNRNAPTSVTYPQMQSREPFSFQPKENKVKQEKKAKKKENSILDKNISRLNNGHLGVEEFIEFLSEGTFANDSGIIAVIRKSVLSNTYQEKIVQALNNPRPYPKRLLDEETKWKTVEKNLQPEETKNISNLSTSPVKFPRPAPPSIDGFPSLGVGQKSVAKSTIQTITENIVILNNGLINAKCFVESMTSLVSREEASSIKKLLRDKIKPEARASEVLNLLDYSLLMNANDSEYPSLAAPQPAAKKPLADALRENIKHLNNGIMTAKEFLKLCSETLTSATASEAIKTVKAGVYNSALSSQITKEIQNRFGLVDFTSDFPSLTMVSLPAEPKRKKGNKKAK